MFHICHFLQPDTSWGTVVSFLRKLNAISSEKSCLISLPFLLTFVDVRTGKLFAHAKSWLVNSNFRRASRMQGSVYVKNWNLDPTNKSMPFFIFQRHHWRSTSGIICGSGSFMVQIGNHFWSGDDLRSGIVCGAVHIPLLSTRQKYVKKYQRNCLGVHSTARSTVIHRKE